MKMTQTDHETSAKREMAGKRERREREREREGGGGEEEEREKERERERERVFGNKHART